VKFLEISNNNFGSFESDALQKRALGFHDENGKIE
jgi:hypothetical protein